MINKNKRYFPDLIEKKWQQVWSKEGLYKFSKKTKKKYYNLVELPYPSGDLHLGHWFAFVPPDAHARYKRMAGYDVFFPNGFDAFGLPAENAAIKRGVHPKDWTMKNIETMTKQFQTMGTMIDWDYTAITCLPEYYRWNQWIFLKMFEKGLAYRGKALSNWCPSCNTVVANENIEAGKCWRCGSEVIQKEVEQWFLKITDYAERLIWPARNASASVAGGPENTEALGRQSRFSNDTRSSFPKNQSQTRSLSESRLSNSKDNQNDQEPSFDSSQSEPAPSGQNHKSFVDWPASNASQSDAGWPKQVKDGQNNWIGKSEGMLIQFPIRVNGSKFMVHGKKNKTINDEQSTIDYIEVFTTRPDTTDGATFLVVAPEHTFVQKLLDKNFQFPISNFQLKEVKEYVEEAKKKTEMERKEDRTKSGIFSGKYVKNPVTGKDIPVWISDYVLAGYGTGAIMAVPFADERDREFAEKFNLPIEKTSFKAKPGGVKKVNYHLHDWSISRQRYWGTPVPIIHCPKDGLVAVPIDDLPVELPYSVDYTPKGKPPLASDEEWLNVKCPKCGGEATRDAETLDTFFDSAWYYYRYVSPQYQKEPFDREKVKQLLPVDVYFGGSEHTLGHTLYARFFTKFFKDLGLVDFDEFALKRVQHGVILGPDGNRMSKSRGNVVNPDEIVKEYGSDAVRLYLCFMMPYEATAPWSVGAISGIYRFLKRVWELQSAISNQQSAISSEDLNQMHKTIKKVGDDLNNFQFNTAVSALMTWLNFLSAKEQVTKEEYETFLKLLAPFAPHITEEIYQRIFNFQFSISNQFNNLAIKQSMENEQLNKVSDSFDSIHLEKWPEYEEKYLTEDEISIVVQVNGKLRETIRVESLKLKVQSFVEEEAKKSEKVQKYLKGQNIKKVIYVEGRLINFVTD